MNEHKSKIQVWFISSFNQTRIVFRNLKPGDYNSIGKGILAPVQPIEHRWPPWRGLWQHRNAYTFWLICLLEFIVWYTCKLHLLYHLSHPSWDRPVNINNPSVLRCLWNSKGVKKVQIVIKDNEIALGILTWKDLQDTHIYFKKQAVAEYPGRQGE